MPRTRRSRFRTLAILFFFGIVIGSCYLLLKSTELQPEPGPLQRVQLVDLEPEDRIETLSSGEFPLAVLEARELGISGRVLDGSLQPLSGFDIVCGSEISRTDDDGRFVFAARRRPGPLAVAVRREGVEVIRWSGVVVGDDAAVPVAYGEVPRPSSLRWSITLFDLASDASPDAAATGDLLTLNGVLVEEWGHSGVVHVNGGGRLPEGSEIHAAIYFEGDRLVSGDHGVGLSNGSYRLRFPLPNGFRFFSDSHEAEISFSTVYHDYETVERWKVEHPGLPWDELSDLAFTKTIYIGLPEEEQEDNLRVQTYYRRVLPTAIDMQVLLEEQFKQSRKLKNGWDPNVVAMKVDSDEGWFVRGAIDRDGQFREAEWRSFIDEQLRPRLRELIREHSLLTDEKFPRANYYLHQLLVEILNLSRMDSLIIYQQIFGLRPHPRDFYHDEYKPSGDRELALKRIREHLALLRRFLDLGEPKAEAESGE
jgi:hypothetical protein